VTITVEKDKAVKDILAEICTRKRTHVAERKTVLPLSVLESRLAEASPPRGFAHALAATAETEGYGLICEIKKASPSKGLIRPDFHPSDLAADYERGGAACLSVLTDRPYFQGDDDYLQQARASAALPALRKDFMVDPYQIVESRVLGADAILLIMAALSDREARTMESLAHDLGMDVLVEVHDRAELDRALGLSSPLIGVNNRNLKTMDVSIDTFLSLAPHVPTDRLLVAESGLASTVDLQRCAEAGARAFLIGETFMRQSDVAGAVRAFRPVEQPSDQQDKQQGAPVNSQTGPTSSESLSA